VVDTTSERSGKHRNQWIMCPAVVRGGFSLGAIVRNPIKDVGDV
jgi:hypothetical protein